MTSQHAAGAEDLQPRRWIALVVLLVASFMNMIDVTIVNVATPRLQASFHATSSQIEWVVAVYILVFALGLLPFEVDPRQPVREHPSLPHRRPSPAWARPARSSRRR